MNFAHATPLLALFIAGVFSSCSAIKSIKIPFVSSGGYSQAVDDPLVSFDVRKPLTYGHTLELSVYQGLRDPSRIFHERVMVDAKGNAPLGKIANVKIGGLTAMQAVRAIESAFHRHDGGGIITVQLARIEQTPLVAVTGAVRTPGMIQFFDGITAASALPYAGGRAGRADMQVIYVTRKGLRTFYRSAGGVELLPGDIVEFSSDF